MVLIAPDDADGRLHAFEFADIVQHLGAVAGDAGRKAQPLRPKDRKRPAIAETHTGCAAIELRELIELRQSIREVRFAFLDSLQAWLRALFGALVVARERTGNGAPEQVGR